MAGQPLGTAGEAEWAQFWTTWSSSLHVFHTRFVDFERHLHVECVGIISDAERFVHSITRS